MNSFLVSPAGLLILGLALILVGLAFCNILEVIYRLAMVFIYGTAYLALTIWDVVVWIVLLPFRIGRWLWRFFCDR